MKQCTSCKKVKEISDFPKHKGYKDGVESWCRDCKKEFAKKWRKENPEKFKDSRRKWRNANREKVRVLNNIWRKAHPEKFAGYSKKSRAKTPERSAAQGRVNTAVRRGKIPPAKALTCSICKVRQADHYHHHKGYKKEYCLDVVPVCHDCHVSIHLFKPD